jgi:UDP-2-acetamido-3-amino-2,3-dideoxy-glucuronate N-acetyltransferase
MLSVAEVGPDIPFEVKRFLAVYDVPSKEVRGERANRTCEQFLMCVRGSVSLVVDDGRQRAEVMLSNTGLGIHVRPMIWTVLYRHTEDAMVLTFASQHYDPEDYIRDYDEFLRLKS